MAQVWIGYCTTLGFEEFICRYIDPYFSEVDEEDPVSEFAGSFGGCNALPEAYEVYARAAFPEDVFDARLFRRLTPFADQTPGLASVDLSNASCMFFMICDHDPTRREDGEVVITDVITVKFDWDEG